MMRFKIYFWLVLSFLLFSDTLKSQEKKEGLRKPLPPSDTLSHAEDTVKKHSPKKAVLYSALLPGAGQVYNKKYWKVPIIYAAMGATVYLYIKEQQDFQSFKNAYVQRLNGELDDFPSQSEQWLLNNMEISRRNRDLMFIATAAVYALNIIDAAVDAHLFHFDVSDDLSLHWQPTLMAGPGKHTATGITIGLRF